MGLIPFNYISRIDIYKTYNRLLTCAETYGDFTPDRGEGDQTHVG